MNRASTTSALIILLLAAPQLGLANPLANSAQKALEERALQLLASEPVEHELQFAISSFRADPYAATPEGRATLVPSATEIAFSGAVGAVNQDPRHPEVEWLWTPGHDWFGLHVPTAKVLMPNVDNVFRLIPVDSTSHYRITAVPTGPLPTQVTLQLLPGLPGEARWSQVIQELLDTDLRTGVGGGYTLSVGPEPAKGSTNHIATTSQSRFILVRDTVADWTHQSPYRLTVTRLDGPPADPPASSAAQATVAASLIHQTVGQVRGMRKKAFFQGPANQLSIPKVREGGRWGLSASGHFHLGDDEALVLTLDPIGAKYLSVQLANAWLGSLDYRNRTASLNNFQTAPNLDGSISFIIATHDPHYHNWLDTTGLHDGTIFLRWQKLAVTSDSAAAAAIRVAKLVKLSDLAATLPAGTAVISDGQRRAQLQERAIGYARRFAATR